MNKRSMFYPNGEMIPYVLPKTFRKSKTKAACGNCGMYSQKRSYCHKFKVIGVKDYYVCDYWRLSHFKR